MKATVFKNRKAAYEYELFDTLECGIKLVGTEVKSLRAGHCVLDGAWVNIERDELWLIGCEITPYEHGTHENHEPKRDRKLLVHRREIERFAKKSLQKGFTLVPVSVYFAPNGYVKVEIAVARGKKSYDKRESLKEREVARRLK